MSQKELKLTEPIFMIDPENVSSCLHTLSQAIFKLQLHVVISNGALEDLAKDTVRSIFLGVKRYSFQKILSKGSYIYDVGKEGGGKKVHIVLHFLNDAVGEGVFENFNVPLLLSTFLQASH